MPFNFYYAFIFISKMLTIQYKTQTAKSRCTFFTIYLNACRDSHFFFHAFRQSLTLYIHQCWNFQLLFRKSLLHIERKSNFCITIRFKLSIIFVFLYFNTNSLSLDQITCLLYKFILALPNSRTFVCRNFCFELWDFYKFLKLPLRFHYFLNSSLMSLKLTQLLNNKEKS